MNNNHNIFSQNSQQLYTISSWVTTYDNAVQSKGFGNWDWIVEWLQTYNVTDNKETNPYWNMNHFDAMSTGDFISSKYNNGEFLPRRCDINCQYLTGLIIDVDNDSILQKSMSIEEAQQFFKKWTYAIIPSYSHLKDGVKHKYRIVLPFNTPIQHSEFDKRKDSFRKVVGYQKPEPLPEHLWYVSPKTGKVIKNDKSTIDNVTFTPAQGYFVPSRPIGAEYFVITNDAEFFDWNVETEIKVEPKYTPIKRDKATISWDGTGKINPRSFDIVSWFQNQGLYIKDEKNGKHQVCCPLHHEHSNESKSGTVIYEGNPDIDMPGKGYPTLSCKHNHGGSINGFKWLAEYIGEEEFADYCMKEVKKDSLLEKFKNKQSTPVTIGSVSEAFELSEPLYAEAFNREKRTKLTNNVYKKWKKISDSQHLLLYAFEGFGKSRVVHTLVNDRQKVVFASKSNQQAEEQFETFRSQGLRVQCVVSREWQLKKLGYSECIIKKSRTNPWESAIIDKDATKRALVNSGMTKEAVEILWSETAIPSIDWSECDVVVMTHARLALIGMIQENKRLGQQIQGVQFDSVETLPKNIVCFWDDVARDDFTWLTEYDTNFVDIELPNGQVIETKTFKKKTKNKKDYDQLYFIKPDCYRYGYGLQNNRQIYSTTEILTSMLIERAFGKDKIFTPELMPTNKMMAGDISVLKTTMTGSKKDGLLLPLLHRVKKEGFDFYLIGDSISPINHTNNKGQNCYTDKDIVVELSQMNLSEIPKWLDELEWTENEIHQLKLIDALDRLHQAVGRNSGYRWSDKHDDDKKSVVVLIDGDLYNNVLEHSRYYINYSDDLDKPNYSTYRKRPRNTLVDCIAWYIQNLDAYITAQGISNGDKVAFERDCRYIYSNTEPKFSERMKTAMTYWSTKTKNPRTPIAIADVLKKIWK